MPYKPLFYKQGVLYLLDQLTLPHKVRFIPCRSAAHAAKAIRDMVIRGAPLIGQTAVWGLYLDCSRAQNETQWKRLWDNAWKILAASRPTARNLVAAMETARVEVHAPGASLKEKKRRFLKFLTRLEGHWDSITDRLAKNGAAVLKPGSTVLTHCNTGRLATLGRGTALSVIEEGWLQGKVAQVYATETRPYLQGARLTMWELEQMKIPGTLICDNMVAHLFTTRKVHAVFTGCDRVAANGDTANKIGTLGIAILAKHYGIPFYIVGPQETIDQNLASGHEIPIEERSTKEVTEINKKPVAPKKARAWHPAFDVTPHELIAGIITEDGIWNPNIPTVSVTPAKAGVQSSSITGFPLSRE